IKSPSLGTDRKITKAELTLVEGERFEYLLKGMKWAGHDQILHLNSWKGAYACGVKDFDRHFGQFIQNLKDQNLFENSVIILTSDHGEEFLEHGGWEHGYSLFNHHVHVPLIIHLPDKTRRERRVHPIASVIDLMPTILDIERITRPAGLEGTTLSTFLNGKP